MDLGTKLLNIIHKKKLSSRGFARLAGVSEQTICNIIKGNIKKPKKRTSKALILHSDGVIAWKDCGYKVE